VFQLDIKSALFDGDWIFNSDHSSGWVAGTIERPRTSYFRNAHHGFVAHNQVFRKRIERCSRDSFNLNNFNAL
jgi:phosphomevalonate kinase